jgi:hypothetical protein
MTAETTKRNLVPLIGYAVIVALAVAVLYLLTVWNSVVDKTTMYHDYWALFWTASSQYGLDFWLGKVSILGRGSFGSATFLQYVPWAFILVVLIHVIRAAFERWKHREVRYLYIWINGAWIIYGLIWLMVATGIAALAHYLNLYSMPVPNMPGVEVKGEVDWLTHFLTPGIFVIPLLSISFYDLFQWKGRRGLLYEAILIILVMSIIMLDWEIGECGNPSVYRNLYWDSVKDIFMGYVSTVLNILVYRQIVPAGIDE